MITTLGLKLIALILKILTWSIPNWFIPTQIETSFTDWINNVMGVNDILPIGLTFICISAILWFYVIVYTFKAVSGLVSLIRGGGEIKI